MPAFAPQPSDLDAFAGTFYGEEIDMTCSVHTEGGKLEVRFRPAQRFVRKG